MYIFHYDNTIYEFCRIIYIYIYIYMYTHVFLITTMNTPPLASARRAHSAGSHLTARGAAYIIHYSY